MTTTEETRAVPEIPATPPPPVPTPARAERTDLVHAIRDIVIMLVLVGGAIAFAFSGHGELAATALGGALAYAVPTGRSRGVPIQMTAIALALTFGALAGGCTAADQLAAKNAFADVLGVVRKVCGGVEAVGRVADGAGITSGGDTGDEEPRTIDGEDPLPGEP